MKILLCFEDAGFERSLKSKLERTGKEVIFDHKFGTDRIISYIKSNEKPDAAVLTESTTSLENMKKIMDATFTGSKDDTIIFYLVPRTFKDRTMELFSAGIMNGILPASAGNKKIEDEICNLIDSPRTNLTARTYYGIMGDDFNPKMATDTLDLTDKSDAILAAEYLAGEEKEKPEERFERVMDSVPESQRKKLALALPRSFTEQIKELPLYQEIITSEPKKKGFLKKAVQETDLPLLESSEVKEMFTPPVKEVKKEEPKKSVLPRYSDRHFHDFKPTGAIAPTCTKNGVNYYECECGEKKEETVQALGHNEPEKGTLIKNADYKSDGLLEFRCTRCNELIRTEKVPMLVCPGHDFDESVDTSPTCTDNGRGKRICKICKFEEEYDIPALGHAEPEKGKEIKAADYKSDGQLEFRCTRCNELLRTEPIPMLICPGHDFDESVDTSPTCTGKGRGKRICKICKFEEDYDIPATGHSYGEWGVTEKATCKSAGIKKRVCTVCGHEDFGEISVSNEHDWGEELLRGNPCIEKATYYHVCKDCETSEDIREAGPLGHDFGEWVTETEPTCGKEGNKYHICKRCKIREDEPIPATGNHQWGEVLTKGEKPCEETIVTYHICKVCETKGTIKIQKPTGHIYGKKTVVTEATCGEPGETLEVCTVCQYENRKKIPPTGEHDWGEIYNDYSDGCDKDVKVCRKCKNCGTVDVLETKPPEGHQFGEWETEVKPTCQTDGKKIRKCARCDEVEEEPVPASEDYHVWGEDFTPNGVAPCKGSRVYYHVCEICKTKAQSRIEPPAPHKWGEEEIVRGKCGAKSRIRKTCIYCGESQIVGYGPITEHLYGEWETVTEATCKTPGLKKRICTECQHDDFKEIPVTEGHKWGEIKTRGTLCTDLKETYRVCEECGEEDIISTIEPTEHDLGEWEVFAEPSCENKGVEERRCKNCTYSETRDIPSLGGHSWGDARYEGNPCLERTDSYRVCTKCEERDDLGPVGPLGHDFGEWKVETEPTCGEEGNKYHICSRCKTREDEPISPTGDHKWGDELYDGNLCEDECEIYHVCEICKTREPVRTNKPTGHVFGMWTVIKPPTCKDKGEQECFCSKCKTRRTENIETAEHNYGEWEEITPATCKSEGQKKRTCKACQHEDFGVIPVSGEHDWGEELCDGNPCIEKATYYHVCKECTKREDIREEGPLDHDYGEWETDTEPTCSKEGLKFRICKRCKDKDIKPIPATNNHKWGKEYIKGNPCLEVAGVYHKCADCETEEKIRDVGPTGHNYGEWDITEKPTCEKGGKREKICKSCGDVFTEELEPLGHVFEKWTITIVPFCIKPGEQQRKCKRCEHVETKILEPVPDAHVWGKDEVEDGSCDTERKVYHVCSLCKTREELRTLPAGEHDFGEWTLRIKPTCKDEGLEERVCKKCAHPETRPVAKTDEHEWGSEDVITPATCLTAGVMSRKCKVCGTLDKETPIPPLGHDFSKENVIVPASCIRKGQVQKKCSRCKATGPVTFVPKTGHKYGEEQFPKIKPTCTKPGIYEVRCLECGAAREDGEIPPTGHTWGEKIVTKKPTCTKDGIYKQICTVCGDEMKGSEKATGHKWKFYLPSISRCENCGKKLVPGFLVYVSFVIVLIMAILTVRSCSGPLSSMDEDVISVAESTETFTETSEETSEEATTKLIETSTETPTKTEEVTETEDESEETETEEETEDTIEESEAATETEEETEETETTTKRETTSATTTAPTTTTTVAATTTQASTTTAAPTTVAPTTTAAPTTVAPTTTAAPTPTPTTAPATTTVAPTTTQATTSADLSSYAGQVMAGANVISLINGGMPVEVISATGDKYAYNCTISGVVTVKDTTYVNKSDSYVLSVSNGVIIANQF